MPCFVRLHYSRQQHFRDTDLDSRPRINAGCCSGDHRRGVVRRIVCAAVDRDGWLVQIDSQGLRENPVDAFGVGSSDRHGVRRAVS